MTRQIRVDAIAMSQVEHLARQEGRSNSEAASRLIAKGYREWRGAAATAALTPVDHETTIRGRTIATHVSNATRAAVEKFAADEERSLSSAMGILLRAGLRAFGVVVPKGNDPVSSSTDRASNNGVTAMT